METRGVQLQVTHALYSFINQAEMKKKWRRRRTILHKIVAELLLRSFRENMC